MGLKFILNIVLIIHVKINSSNVIWICKMLMFTI